MTDLKTANTLLAAALTALESPEHEADCAEAEAIRNRLLDLDATIAARIQAKLDAHRLIVDRWGVPEVPAKPVQDAPIVEITDPLKVFNADAWDAHHAEAVGKYALTGDAVPEAVLMNGVAEMSQEADA